jgi:hypothetical protein
VTPFLVIAVGLFAALVVAVIALPERRASHAPLILAALTALWICLTVLGAVSLAGGTR